GRGRHDVHRMSPGHRAQAAGGAGRGASSRSTGDVGDSSSAGTIGDAGSAACAAVMAREAHVTTHAVRPSEPSAGLRGGKSLPMLLRRLVLPTRPAFLTASVLPVLVGTAWGYRIAHRLDVLSFVLGVLATVLVHGGSNVRNGGGVDYGG